jgi:hypothetical protein
MAKKRIRNSDWEGMPVKRSASTALVTRNGAPKGLNPAAKESLALLQQLTRNNVTSRMAFVQWALDQLHDVNKECGYPETISAQEYKQMYEREGIASRVVSIYPTETWVVEPEIYEDEDIGTITPFEAAWENVNQRLGMLEKMSRLDELCGIGHYGVLFVGVNDGVTYDQPIAGVEEKLYEMFMWDRAKQKQAKPGTTPTIETGDTKPVEKKPETQQAAAAAGGVDNVFGDNRIHYPGEYGSPENEPQKQPPGALPPDARQKAGSNGKPSTDKKAKRDILFVIPLDETQASISELENDPNSWRFGKPKYYNLTFFDPTSYSGMFAVPTGSQTRVHWTRVVHAVDNCKSNELFGQPRQKKVYNYLLNIRKILGGTAEMQWKVGFPGYSFEVPPEINDQVELDRESLSKEVDLYMNTLKKYMSLQGVQAKVLQGSVSDPTPVIDTQILAICIAIEVPKRVFMGTEEAKLASIEDATAWLNRVKARQHKQVTPRLIRPIVDLFIAIGALPDAEYQVDWADLHSTSDADRASIAAQLTQAIVQYIAGGGDSLIPPLEFLTLILQMDKETAIAVLQAAEERLTELEGPHQEQQDMQMEMDQQKFDQQLEVQKVMADGIAEGAKKGGVNLPHGVLANPANQPPAFGPRRGNLPLPSRNQYGEHYWQPTMNQLVEFSQSDPFLEMLANSAIDSLLLETVREAPVTNLEVNVPRQPAPVVNVELKMPEPQPMPAPIVNVTNQVPEQQVPVVNVTNQVPEQPAPVVNIEAPELVAPVVNVTIPKQDPPNVSVNVPEAPAPIVNVEQPPQAEFDVVPVRNEKGQITKWKRVPKQ